MQKNILLLTGWGSTCAVWEPIIPALTEAFQVNCISPRWVKGSHINTSLSNIDGYIEDLANNISTPLNVVAWSMGGLLAIKLAYCFPELVNKICFISSVPRFVHVHNEQAGIDYQWFKRFVEHYQINPIATLNKFLALQVKNDSAAKSCLRFLRSNNDYASFDFEECGFGLKLLQQLDLVTQLKALKCELIYVHGEQDAVVGIESARFAADITNSKIHVIAGAGHTPHISQPNKVADIITKYLQ